MEANKTITNEFATHFEQLEIELFDTDNDKLTEILQSVSLTKESNELVKRDKFVVMINSYPTSSSYEEYFKELLEDFTSEVEQNMKEYAKKYKVLVYLKKMKFQFKKYWDNYMPIVYGSEFSVNGIGHKYLVMNEKIRNDYNNANFHDISYFLNQICLIQQKYLKIILEYLDFLTEIIVLVPENSLVDSEIIENTKPFIVYTGEFSKTTSKNIEAIEVLDKYQIGLLFHYLMQAGIFLNFPPKEIAKSSSILTGFAQKQLYEEACSPIIRVKKDKNCNKYKGIEKPVNLNRLKLELLKVINLIDKDIDENLPKKSKKTVS